MKWTITGRLKDSEITSDITWEDGVLSGEPIGVELAKGLAEAYERVGMWIGNPEGPSARSGYISSPYIAARLVQEIMQPYSMHHTGDVPPLSDPLNRP
jgi:hypothetical protein